MSTIDMEDPSVANILMDLAMQPHAPRAPHTSHAPQLHAPEPVARHSPVIEDPRSKKIMRV